MTDLIIDITDTGAFVSTQNELLVVEAKDGSRSTVPLKEVAAVIVAHPAVTLTRSVLAGLAAHGGMLVACDGRRLPAAMTLPLQHHSLQTERLRVQVETPLPRKKRIWQAIVRAKVRAQAAALHIATGGDQGLGVLVAQVRSGDTTNVEARAARIYWPALFGGSFRRDPQGPEPNSLLNYGYAVLRAIVARAIAGAGLHPSLGVHHHNRYDPFCLADDLMEPFRPWVDLEVARLLQESDGTPTVDRDTKRRLVQTLGQRYVIDGERRTLFDIASRVASALVDALASGRPKLPYPAGPAQDE